MCRKLNIPRSLVYYKRKEKKINSKLENAVIKIFKDSKNNYGARKIKVELAKLDIIASIKRIRRIMDKYGLISNYTLKQFKVTKSKCNEDNIPNELDRNFNNRDYLEIVISDLTYVICQVLFIQMPLMLIRIFQIHYKYPFIIKYRYNL